MNILYPSYKNGLLSKTADWVTDPINVALFDAGALYQAGDTNLSNILGAQVSSGGDEDIVGKSAIDGFAIGPAVLYSNLYSTITVHVAIMYRSSDGALVAFLDSVVGLAFRPNGNGYALLPTGPNGSYFAL